MPYRKGFTLIELMITLAVLAIVLGIAVPGFNDSIGNNRSIALGGDLVTALNFARTEAIKRSTRVSICPSSNGTSCLGAGNWDKGWIVFTDTAATDSAVLATVDTVLKYWGEITDKAVIAGKRGSVSDLAYIRFTSNGVLARVNTADAVLRTFDVSVKGCKQKSATTVTVGLAGLVTSKKTLCP